MQNFTSSLMDMILEGMKIPKVQVERAVAPIIAMFVGDVLKSFLAASESDRYVLVSQEFPLKKDNNQSTNIDFLLVNDHRHQLIFVELKTDLSSFDSKQAKIYEEIKGRVAKESAAFLWEDLSEISNHSTKKFKYEYLKANFQDHIPDPGKITDALIVYMVPEALKEKVRRSSAAIDHVISFRELSRDIHSDHACEWAIVREKLTVLDDGQAGTIVEGEAFFANILENVERFAQSRSIAPVEINLGKSGNQIRPNYQVRFSDGLEQAFRNNGAVFQEPGFRFKPDNLDVGITWEEFKNDVRNE